MCEGGKISQEYAEFNKVKLFYLKNRSEIMLFVAVYTDRLSGGFGNQIEAITSALVFAMLTKSAFDWYDLAMYLLDLNTFAFPNAVQWNSDLPSGLSVA